VTLQRHCRYNESMAEIEQIKSRIMVWARETAGLSLEEAAEKLGLETSSRTTGAEKLARTWHRRRSSHWPDRGDGGYDATLSGLAVRKFPPHTSSGRDGVGNHFTHWGA
jgi:hypothetical protein